MILESELLAGFPAEVHVAAADVAATVSDSNRVLVVLDDDPTGTQSVANLPVLTRWTEEDFVWAFTHQIDGARAGAVYVLTNTRSLDPAEAAERNRQIVTSALAAAETTGTVVGFVSRSDSTLRGHYPLEPDTIAETLAATTGATADGVVIVPAFPDAGRITIGGVHYMRTAGGTLTPTGETEFAQDATFGYTNSRLADYVQEKSLGRFQAADVIVVDLNLLRTGTPAEGAAAVADAIAAATDSTPIVVDTVTENDLRILALGLDEAERRGKTLIYRVGPPFVRARIGQEIHPELETSEIFTQDETAGAAGGLIVVGSHVGVTTRQLKALTEQHRSASIIEIDVEQLLGEDAAAHLDGTVSAVVTALATGDVIVHTSRLLIKTDDAAASLRIARSVSAAVVEVVNRTLKTSPPRFVIAKGGITSSDVAAHGLEIRHAIVRGPMLPGIVSLWEPVGGPAAGIPYIVFAGNVGDDQSLAQVTRKLSSTF
ncbi:four-carbon acid sugar kinase family protein [Arthrobacter sp. 35W]|uniref:four-carbon acid sugar kinase family protein n=1 Tax=Arthrobacter sp. 35W TaxID=1132441 RepID=UPI00040E9E0E|nr:four-carbon acid sugar kinase family protein [Arthrobacter sp. 35W]